MIIFQLLGELIVFVVSAIVALITFSIMVALFIFVAAALAVFFMR